MAEAEEKREAESQPEPEEPKAKARTKWNPVRAKARPKVVEPEVEKLDGQLGRIQAQLLLLERISRNPW